MDVCCYLLQGVPVPVCSLVKLPFPSLGRDATIWRLGDRVDMWEGKSEEGQAVSQRKHTDWLGVCSTSWTPLCSCLGTC